LLLFLYNRAAPQKFKINLNQKFDSSSKGNNSKPVKYYPNSDTSKVQILSDNQDKSG
jgi:hypothetical protein